MITDPTIHSSCYSFSYHPSIFVRLSEVGSRRQQVQERNPDIPLPSRSRSIPWPEAIYNPSSESWVCPGAFSLSRMVWREDLDADIAKEQDLFQNTDKRNKQKARLSRKTKHRKL